MSKVNVQVPGGRPGFSQKRLELGLGLSLAIISNFRKLVSRASKYFQESSNQDITTSQIFS